MKKVCVCCGALFVEGKGFVEKHLSGCGNEMGGWNYYHTVPISWERPTKTFEGANKKLKKITLKKL